MTPITRLLLLVAVRPELLEVGPKVSDVLVVLHADKAIRVPGISCIGARMYFGNVSSLQVIPDPLLAGSKSKPSKLPALRPSTGVERRPKLDFGRFADFVAGGAKTLEHLLAGSGILRQGRARRSCK